MKYFKEELGWKMHIIIQKNYYFELLFCILTIKSSTLLKMIDINK